MWEKLNLVKVGYEKTKRERSISEEKHSLNCVMKQYNIHIGIGLPHHVKYVYIY